MTSRRISLRKRPSPDVPAAVEEVPEAGPGKGRPTPKRRDAEKRRGPVAPPPATRREAARRARAEQADARKGVRAASLAKDQSRMLPRDAGPVRALVRDMVDTRRNVAVLMLPFALAVLLVRLLGSVFLTDLLTRIWTLTLFLVLADLFVLAIVIRRQVRASFPAEKRTRAHVGYGLMRSTTFRRLRMPPARVRPAGLLGR